MGEEAAKLTAKIGADDRDYQKKMKRSDNTMKKTAKSMRQQADEMARTVSGGLLGMGGMVGLGGAMMLARQFANVSLELGTMGMELEQAEAMYGRMSDAGIAGLQQLQAATNNAMSATGAMSIATKFMAMGLADTNKEAAQLMETVTALARLMRRDVGAAMEDFALLLANQSMLRLDQFGMSSARVKIRMKELQEANASLTREQAFTTATMEDAQKVLALVGDTAGSNIEKVGQLRAAWADLKGEMGRGAGEAMAEEASAIAVVVKEATGAVQVQNAFRNATKEARATVEESYRTNTINAETYKRLSKEIDNANFTQKTFVLTTQAGIDATKLYIERMNELTARAGAWRGELRDMNIVLSEHKDMLLSAADAMATAIARQQEFFAGQWDIAASGATSGEWGEYVGTRGPLEAAAGVKRGEYWAEVAENAKKTAESIGDADARAQDLLSTIKSIAFVTGRVSAADMWATELGIYGTPEHPEKPDEYIRRLKSALRDQESEWKHLLGGRTGAEAQYFAWGEEQKFEQGRWGEMGPGFDYEKAVAASAGLVEAQLKAQEQQAQVAKDIAAHLGVEIEMAFNAQTGKFESVGADLADSIIDGAITEIEEGAGGLVEALYETLYDKLEGGDYRP